MSELDFVMLILFYAAGFFTGGVFWYDLGRQKADQKNIERINKILGCHLNNPEARENDE